MYVRLLSLYLSGRMDIVALDTAVSKRWISPEERDMIVASKE